MSVEEQPFGYLYETKAGIRIFHKIGDCSPRLLALDKQAALDYPEVHKITPVYTRPQPPAGDDE